MNSCNDFKEKTALLLIDDFKVLTLHAPKYYTKFSYLVFLSNGIQREIIAMGLVS